MSDTKRIESYELVQIGTGKRVTPPYMNRNQYGVRAVLAEGLKKDGTPNATSYRGRLPMYDPAIESALPWGSEPQLSDYVRYDPAQESLAEPIRAEIAQLRSALADAKACLLAVYKKS